MFTFGMVRIRLISFVSSLLIIRSLYCCIIVNRGSNNNNNKSHLTVVDAFHVHHQHQQQQQQLSLLLTIRRKDNMKNTLFNDRMVRSALLSSKTTTKSTTSRTISSTFLSLQKPTISISNSLSRSALSLSSTVIKTTTNTNRNVRPAFSCTLLHSTTSDTIIGTPETSFDDGKRPFQITTPIYYVNDKPHIGHAYTTVACDVIARFMRLSGREVYFLTGTDEHGQKVELSAANKNMNPQEFVNTVSVNFRDLLVLLNISNNQFIRTTDTYHKTAVQHFWNVLTTNGYIYLDTYSGWYSVRDECFYTESELIDGKAPTGADVEWVAKEQSYFFKLSNFQDQLLQYYEDNPDFIAPESRKKEVISFVKGGLRDLSISRTSFKWGIPVPNDPDHVMYVWIDALTNYISALGYGSVDSDTSNDDNDDTNNNNFIKFWPASLHIVGKDILRFHAVYWPALLMAASIPIPKRLFAHGWWTKDGQKISKSIGNVIDPIELIAKYGVDPTRFFLMSEVNFGNDGDYSDKSLVLKVNTNLANEFGNLCQRTMSMVYKNCNQAVPYPNDYTDADKQLLASAQQLQEKAATAISKQAIHKYSEAVVTMIVEANKYIDDQAPWVLRKTDTERMNTVLYVIMEVLRYTAILYQPLIPDSANKVLDLITVPNDERTFAYLNDTYKIKPGNAVTQPVGIFPRIELPEEQLVDA